MHAFVNELARPLGTYLYGRRMYETMAPWETMALAEQSPVAGDFALAWRAAEKVVYSTSLPAPTTARTRVEREFDPEAVRRLKADSPRDLGIGGATLAAEALDAGVVDELHLLLVPVLVGGGKRAVSTTRHTPLELVDTRRFASGVVHLHYVVAS